MIIINVSGGEEEDEVTDDVEEEENRIRQEKRVKQGINNGVF